jgi:hypothetical protein
MVGAAGIEPASRANPALAAYKTAALPLSYAPTRWLRRKGSNLQSLGSEPSALPIWPLRKKLVKEFYLTIITSMTAIELICDECKSTFLRKAALHKSNIRRGRKGTFCSLICNNRHVSNQRRTPRIYTSCNRCGKQVVRAQKDARRAKHQLFFCSRECSIMHYAPRRPEHPVSCIECAQPFLRNGSGKRKCPECISIRRNRSLMRTKVNLTHPEIRSHARQLLTMAALVNSCRNCGYSKHVEVCHIKPVSHFLSTATLAEINTISNLVVLCPNCHWELDHDLLKLS